MHFIRHLLQHIDVAMKRSLSDAREQVVILGAMAMIAFPLFYWIWSESYPQPYESAFLRGLGGFLGLGLMLSPYWPVRLKPYLHWYCFFSILYALPFFFAFSFLMNEATVVAAMSLMCSIFLLVLLVDIPTMVVLLCIGWGGALCAYMIFAPRIYFGEEHMEMLLVSLFVIVVGSTVNYKTALIQQQRLDGMAAVAGMIAHELRTPLLGIRSGAQAFERYQNTLFEGFKQAVLHNLVAIAPRELRRIEQLSAVHPRIIHEIDYANTIIDMLLIKAGREKALENCLLDPCSMQECLDNAMERYPFKNDDERELVHYQGDFRFIGSPLLMQHVLFNLLKNALYAIASAQKGDIHIWTDEEPTANLLYFKDTGKGMSELQVSQLFQHFYTTTFMGTGLGLSFCKLVMERFGGGIECMAREGSYTLFTLRFPKCAAEYPVL